MTHQFEWRMEGEWEEATVETAVLLSHATRYNGLTLSMMRAGTAVLGLWLVWLLRDLVVRGYLYAGGTATTAQVVQITLSLLFFAFCFAALTSQMQQFGRQRLHFPAAWRKLSIILAVEMVLLLFGMFINRWFDIVTMSSG